MTKIAIGLMSGTSCDGVDAALLQSDGESDIAFLGGLTIPYDNELRSRLQEASQHDVPLTGLLRLEAEITDPHIQAIHGLLKDYPATAKQAAVVGFHGHTVRHVPNEGLTLQIGNPWRLAKEGSSD